MDIDFDKVEKISNNEILYKDVGKTIREAFLEKRKFITYFLSDKVKDFYDTNNIFIQRAKIGKEDEWNKSTLKRFYEVVAKNPLNDKMIAAFNSNYIISEQLKGGTNTGNYGADNDALVKGLNRIEEITYFLNAHQYSNPTFQETVLTKSMELLYKGNIKQLSNLCSALNNNTDALTITSILNSNDFLKNKESTFDTLKLEKAVNKIEKNNEFIDDCIGGILATANAIILMNFSTINSWAIKQANEKLHDLADEVEKGVNLFKNFTPNMYNFAQENIRHAGNYIMGQFPSLAHLDYTSIGITALTISAVLLAGKVYGSVFKNIYESRKENKVGFLDVNKCDQDNFKFFTRNNLINGLIKRKEFNVEDPQNINHVLLTGFLIDKIYEPSKKVEDYKDQASRNLKDVLGLSDNEVKRLNNITVEEIATISQIKNLQFRDAMMKSEFSPEDLLAARRVDNIQRVIGLNLEQKGEYFKNIDPNSIYNEINKHINNPTTSKVKKEIILNYLRNTAIKDKKTLKVSENSQDVIFQAITTTPNNETFYKEIIENYETHIDQEKIKDLIKEQKKEIQLANNSEVKELISKKLKEFDMSCQEELIKSYNIEDGFFHIIKNKTANVINNLRKSIQGISSTHIP